MDLRELPGALIPIAPTDSLFRVLKIKKNGYPKVSVLVRQKGLEPLTY